MAQTFLKSVHMRGSSESSWKYSILTKPGMDLKHNTKIGIIFLFVLIFHKLRETPLYLKFKSRSDFCSTFASSGNSHEELGNSTRLK